MSVSETFGAPFVEIVDGQEISFPLMTMDDWAACVNQLKANRRREAEKRLIANDRVGPSERESLLLAIDREIVPMAYACAYRTEEPAGIRATLTKSLVTSGKSEDEAKQIISKIPPVRQARIAKMIADPPIAQPGAKPSAEKNDPAAQSATGDSTPPSSESSGESTHDA